MSIKIGGDVVISDAEKGIFDGSVNPGEFTTTERDALSTGWTADDNGTIIWNSTDSQLQVYNHPNWENASSGSFSVDRPVMINPENNGNVPDPNLVELTCEPYDAQPSVGVLPYGSSKWQIATTEDFTPADTVVIDVTNSSETSYTLSAVPPVTADVATSTLSGSKYNLTFDATTNLDKFEDGDEVSCNAIDSSTEINGLRFNSKASPSTNVTSLSTNLPQAITTTTPWTVSMWVKSSNTQTTTSDYEDYLIKWGNPGDSGTFAIHTKLNRGDGNKILWVWNGSSGTNLGLTLFQNQWHNIVVQYDGNGKMSAWRDNLEGIQNINTNVPSPMDEICVISGNGQGPTTNGFNGYMSEVYFVTGQALKPDSFGYTNNDGNWAPLSPSTIKDAIDYRFGEENPFETRYNGDEDWNSKLSSPGTLKSNGGGAFAPGIDVSVGKSEGVGGLTFTPGTAIPFTKTVEVYNNGPNQFRLNPTAQEIADNDGWIGGTGWVKLNTENSGSTVVKIEAIRADNPDYDAGFYGIRVDGRQLVCSSTGPANVSHNWANMVTGIPASYSNSSILNYGPPINAFDGREDNASYAEIGSQLTFVPKAATGSAVGSGTIQLLLICDASTSSSGRLILNGNDITSYVQSNGISNGGNPAWVTLDSSYTEIESLEWVRAGSNDWMALGGIKIGNELLLDSGPNWNTSQSYTKNANALPYADNPWTSAFDGQVTTNLGSPNGAAYNNVNNVPGTITFDTPITGYVIAQTSTGSGSDNGSAKGTIDFLYQGSTVGQASGDSSTVKPKWHVVNGGTSITFDEIKMYATASNGVSLGSILVDGKLLVDNAPFGIDGFYLPFDRDASSTKYSSKINPLSSLSNDADPKVVYDGYWHGSGRTYLNFTSKLYVFMGDEPADLNTKLSIFTNLTANGVIWVNGNNVSLDTTSNNDWQWFDVTPGEWGDNNIQTIEMQDNVIAGVAAIRIGDRILLDSPSVCQDASGNNNHFTEYNLALGDTSDVWSNGVTMGPPNNLYGSQFLFNGRVGNYGGTWVDREYCYQYTTDAEGSLSGLDIGDGVKSIRICGYNNSAATDNIIINDTASYTLPYNKTRWIPISEKKINKITWPGSVGTSYVSAIDVDGEILCNPNFKDPSLDTPLTSYANLVASNSPGTNVGDGNLMLDSDGSQYNAWSSQLAPGKYYGELTANSSFTSSSFVGGGFNRTTGSVSDASPYGYGIVSIVYTNSVSVYTQTDALGQSATLSAAKWGSNGFTYMPYDMVLSFLVDADDNYGSVFINGQLIWSGEATTAWTFVHYVLRNSNGQSSNINVGSQPFAYAINGNNGTGQIIPNFKTGAVYSSGVESSNGWSSAEGIGAFDGPLNPAAGSAANGTITFTNTFGLSGKVRVWTWIQGVNAGASGNDQRVRVDGGDWQFTNIDTQNYGWFDLGDIGEFTTIELEGLNAGAAYLGGVEVNGSILIDDGIWNTDENWSRTLVAASDAFVNDTTSVLGFNGVPLLSGSRAADSPTGTASALTWTGSIPVKNKIRISTGGVNQVNLNFAAVDMGTTTDDPEWLEYTPPGSPDSTFVLEQFQVLGASSGSRADLYAVEVDGKILVDKTFVDAQTFRTGTATQSAAGGTIKLSGTVDSVDPASSPQMVVTPTDASDWSIAPGSPVTGQGKTGLQNDTTYYARVTHSSTTGVESQPAVPHKFTTGTPTPPPVTDTPGSLRFSGADAGYGKTLLTKPYDYTDTFTLSFWAKGEWSATRDQYLVKEGGSQGGLFVNAGGFFWNAGGYATISQAPNDWEWAHICFTSDADSFENKSVLWINGVRTGTGPKVQIGGYPFNEPAFSTQGTYVFNICSTIDSIDGSSPKQGDFYMADFYLVDGTAFQPSAFAREVDGVWRPRSAANIAADINDVNIGLPSAIQNNQAAAWLDDITANPYGAGSSALVFNGTPTGDGLTTGNANDSTITFAPTVAVPITKELRLWGKCGPDASGKVTIGDVEMTYTDAGNTHILQDWDMSRFIGKTIDTTTPLVISNTNAGQSVEINQIQVDYKVLVDGPVEEGLFSKAATWDTGVSLARVQRIFDGLTSTDCQSDQGFSGEITWPANLIGNGTDSSIEIYFAGNITDPKVNGVEQSITGYAWNAVSFNTITSIEFLHPAGGGSVCNPCAIRVDGKILRDPAQPWNMDHVWSESALVYQQNYPARRAFNGRLSTFDGGNAYATPCGENPQNSGGAKDGVQPLYDIPCTNEFLLYGAVSEGNTTGVKVKTNITTHTINITGGAGSNVIAFDLGAEITKPCTLEKIEWTAANNGAELAMYGLQVDGKLLVDNRPLGNDGMYLSFDTTKTSENYTAITTSDFPAGKVQNMYNGTASTANCPNSGVTGDTIVIEKDFGNVNSVGVYQGGIGNFTISVNNGAGDLTSPTIAGENTQCNLYTHILPELTNVTRITVTVIGGSLACYGFEVDGKLLVDHAAVGVPSSSGSNIMHDINLNVGNTQYSLYSNYTDITASATTNWADPMNYQMIFNGNLGANDYGTANSASGSKQAVVTFNTDIPITESINVYGSAQNGGSSGTNSIVIYTDADPINGVDIAPWLANGSNANMDWTENLLPHLTGTPTKLTKIKVWNDGAQSIGYCGGIMIDGKLLIANNVQDSMLDTPTDQYAITGNHVATTALSAGQLYLASGTTWGSCYSNKSFNSGKYYFEFSTQYIEPGTSAADNAYAYVGICREDQKNTAEYPGANAYSWGLLMGQGGGMVYDAAGGGTPIAITPAPLAGDTIGCLADLTVGTMTYYIVNPTTETPEFVKNASTDEPQVFNNLPVNTAMLWAYDVYNQQGQVNFGQQPFAYADNTNLDQGKVTVGGIEASTLFTPEVQALTQSNRGGDYFYVPALKRAVSANDLKRKFNITGEDIASGVYALTDQPINGTEKYSFQSHVNKYTPVRNYREEYDRLESLLEEVSQAWSPNDSYVNGQIISYNGKYYVVTDDYTVGATEQFDPDATYITAVRQ